MKDQGVDKKPDEYLKEQNYQKWKNTVIKILVRNSERHYITITHGWQEITELETKKLPRMHRETKIWRILKRLKDQEARMKSGNLHLQMEKKNGGELTSKKHVRDFQELIEDNNPQIQESQQTPSMIKYKEMFTKTYLCETTVNIKTRRNTYKQLKGKSCL